jgi:hypothetical protein
MQFDGLITIDSSLKWVGQFLDRNTLYFRVPIFLQEVTQ